MWRSISILLLLILIQPPDPQFTAHWTGTTSATVTWQQQQRACLYHENARGYQTFVGCYDGAGKVTISFGKVGPLSGDLRPMAGDVYVAQIDGQTHRAPLQARELLPILQR